MVKVGLLVALIAVTAGFFERNNFYAALRYPPIPKSQYSVIKKAREFCKLPPGTEAVIAAVASVESGFDLEAESGAGAVGAMQLLIPTGYGMAVKKGIPNVRAGTYKLAEQNYTMGSCYLQYLMEYLTGDGSNAAYWNDKVKLLSVFNAYNGGPNSGRIALGNGGNGAGYPARYAYKVYERIAVYANDIRLLEQEGNTSPVDLLSQNVRNLFWRVLEPEDETQ